MGEESRLKLKLLRKELFRGSSRSISKGSTATSAQLLLSLYCLRSEGKGRVEVVVSKLQQKNLKLQKQPARGTRFILNGSSYMAGPAEYVKISASGRNCTALLE